MLCCARLAPRNPQLLAPACVLLTVMLSQVGLGQPPGDDVSRLAHPDVAERLGLSDQQMVEIQRLLQARTDALADSESETAPQRAAELSKQILEQLTAEQATLFQDSGPTTKLKFQFRDQKWSEVLEWFAKQEGLTLVIDRAPPGTFTYSDTRSYTASQAIDLLNSVLLTRGFTLIRRERMLLVQPLGDSIPTELIPLIKLSDLPARGKFELVRVEFGLGGRPIDAVLREVTPYLGNYGRAIPLPQSGQLVVIESAGKMEMINRLISSVPVPKQPAPPPPRDKPPEPVFAAYGLGQLDPISTLETIRKLIPSEQITVDPQTRVLSAFLVPGQQQAIQSAIEKMQQDISQATPLASAAFTIGATEQQAVRDQLMASFPRAVINYDSGNQRLLVTSDAKSLDGIKQVLEALGVQLVPEDAMVTATLPITEGTASSIAASLQQLLPTLQAVGNDQTSVVVVRGTPSLVQAAEQIAKNLGSEAPAANIRLERFPLSRSADAAWLAQIQRLVPKAQLWLTPDNQQLVAWAGPSQLEALADMLPAVSELLPEKKERQLETYQLDSRQRAQFESMLESLSGGRQDVRLLPGTRSGELLIWGTEQQQREIAEMVQKLHTLLPAADPRLPQLYRWELQETTETLKRLREQFPDAQFELDAATNQLTVWADDTTQPQISQWIKQLTERLPPKPQLQLASYGVPEMPASRLQTILGPLLSGVQTTVDLEQQRLLVWATPREHQEIQELVDQLAQQPAVDQQRVLLAYQLQHADAETLRQLLVTMLEGATLVVDQKTKQLLATATLPQHAKIKTTIAQLDQPGRAGDEEAVESFTFRKIQAVNIVASLSQLWPDVRMTVDPSSNTLVASGPQRLLTEVRQAVDRMNRVETDDEGFSIRTYPAPGGDLRSLPGVLSQIAPEAIVSADWANRTLVVWGSQRDQERVSQALEQLNQAIDERQTLKIYSPPVAQSEGIRATLTTLFPRANITSLGKSGQLAVMASPDVHQRVADVLEKIEAAEDGSGAETRILPIDRNRADVASLALSLRSQMPASVTLTPLVTANTLLAAGPGDQLDRLEQQLEQLQQPLPESFRRQSKVYNLRHADPLAAVTVLRTLSPTATVAADANSRSVAATATAEEHRSIDEFLKAYDVLPEQAGLVRVYRVTREDPRQVAVSLKELLPTATVSPSRSGSTLIVTASELEHQQIEQIIADIERRGGREEVTRSYSLLAADPRPLQTALAEAFPEATLAADSVNGELIATATEVEHAAISSVVDDLNASGGRRPRLRSFVLKHLPASAVAEALQQALGRRSQTGVTADDALQLLLVLGPPSDLELAEQLVEQIDQPTIARQERRLKTFTLTGFNGSSIADSIRSLLENQRPEAEINFDPIRQKLVVIGTADQLQQVEETLDQFMPAERELELFRLKYNEPQTVRSAINSLFTELPLSETPTVTVDESLQQILVRATASQLEQVRGLLVTLGEPLERLAPSDSSGGRIDRGQLAPPMAPSSSRVRRIPVRIDPSTLQRELDRRWPATGRNRLEWVQLPTTDAAAPAAERAVTDQPADQPAPPAEESEAAESDDNQPAPKPGNPAIAPQPTPTLAAVERQPANEQRETPITQLISISSMSPEPPSDDGDAAFIEPTSALDDRVAEEALPPILIIPGEDGLTIASEDTRALDALERLLEAMQEPQRMAPAIETGNVSLYLLKNSGAEAMEQLLNSLFRRGGERGRGDRELGGSLMRTTIVADARTNALVISGPRADRKVIEEIISVLDDERLVGSLQLPTPRLVPVRNTNAERIEAVLREVYRSQMTAGGRGRRPITIPEGVSAEVQSILQQINIEATSPLLTVAVDETSNSLIIRAPMELSREVVDFISELDSSARSNQTRRTDIITLETMNSRQLEQALDILQRRGGGGGRSGRRR